MAMTGIQIFLELLAEYGVRHIFGNPGTTELPLNDALVGDSRFQYVLGLQEVPVMAMADGYAMASKNVGVVNLHICCGLGNAMGILYNAFREGTPLIVTAGQQDRRLQLSEPILGGDMVSVARPWTKWSYEINRVQDFAPALRRAIQTAMTPPTGPVFLSMPLDVQMELCPDPDLAPVRLPDARVRPPTNALQRAAEVLLAARNPAFLAGSRVTEAGAENELVQLAELVGTPVLIEPGTTHGRLPFPSDHPLNGQGLPLWSSELNQRLHEFDVLFVVGMDLFRLYVHAEPSLAIPKHVRIVHLDEDPRQLGKNYATEVGLVGHTKTGLQELIAHVRELMTTEHQREISSRAARVSAMHAATREQLRTAAENQPDVQPPTSLAVMHAISSVLPSNAAVIEEAVTSTNTTLERLGALKNTDGYFGHRGWTLGWGLGCTIGVQLAWPDRPVIGLLGEGAAMYGIQGLWTAARYRIPATFVICNNAQYQILKIGAKGLNLPRAEEGRFEGLDITGPEIDFVSLAQSLGVKALRVSTPDELAETLRVRFSSPVTLPLLIDMPIARETPSRLNYG